MKADKSRSGATLRIRLVMPLDITFGRNIIAGVFRYLRLNHCPWTIEMTNGYATLEDRSDSSASPPDGIIGGLCPMVRDAIRADSPSKTPTVALEIGRPIDSRMRKTGIALIQTDNEAIGRKAGETLMDCGSMRSFAYIHNPSVNNATLPSFRLWTSVRCKAFAATIRRRKMPFRVFSWRRDESLARFLAKLPKPAGVFAGNDRIALDILATCNAQRIAVPKDLALISVDNDPLYCDNVSPTISSIALNAEEEGYLAGKELDRLLESAGRCKSRMTMIQPGDVILRESTTFTSPAAVLVEHALAYIHDNVDSGIKVGDVANAVGVSRRLLELRFKECHQPTIGDSIRNARFRHVERLLDETSLPIGRIADSCGFPSATSLMRAFKKRYGVTMRSFREAASGK
jgi:LacI family transcriptional regulator